MRLVLILIVAVITWGCGGDANATKFARPAPPAPAGMKGDLIKGSRVYMANCTACHNADPSFPGAIGPEIKGSSRALIEARVLHNTYPEGYKPKRSTHNMVALPHLAGDIDDLAAFLR
jgi:mono/diheme cytochrome c family protein